MLCFIRVTSFVVAGLFVITAAAQTREWTYADSGYVFKAELVGFDDENVVLRRTDNQLGMTKIEELSEADREFLKSKESVENSNRNINKTQTWVTNSGLKLVGRVVDYVRGDMVVQRRRRTFYVNDRRFRNLPELYQKLLPKIVEHFDGIEIPDDRALQNWLRSQEGKPRTFHIEGVKLEVENGDEYSIPFFVFSEQDRKLLQAGWASWIVSRDEYERHAEEAFRLEALAAAYFKNQKIHRQIAEMNLMMQAVQAGITSAWEVSLYPLPGNPRPPKWVVVPGRNSLEATELALQNNPGFVDGPVRRLNRRR